jgi:phosphohistidine phosphatase
MQVLLIRHGIAIDEKPGLGDEERFLTAEGRKKTQLVGALLRKQMGRLDRVLTSPLVRAVQTAEIVARELECEDVRVAMALAPGAAMSRVDAAIEDALDAERLALVGHEPAMSAIAAHLLGLSSFPRAFKKAGVCAVTLDEPGAVGTFEWFIVPRGPKVESTLASDD